MDAFTDGTNTQPAQEILVLHHLMLVKRIAYHMRARLPQWVLVDDLLQAGMLGLIEAAKNYDPSKGASFETYAGIRIKGFMLDEIRQNDWVPRSVHRNSRMISEAIRQVEHQQGRSAKDCEVAEILDMSLEDYHQILQDSNSSHLYGFTDLGLSDDFLPTDAPTATEPAHHVQHNDLIDQISEVIDHLPPKERMAMSLYYEHDLNLKEIGEILDVGESRASQILSQAVHRTKARVTQVL